MEAIAYTIIALVAAAIAWKMFKNKDEKPSSDDKFHRPGPKPERPEK